VKLTDFRILTFDCYGTLIDWETGLGEALAPLARKAHRPESRDQLLEAFGRHEVSQQAQTPDLVYSQLLARVYRRLAKEWDARVTDEEASAFGASVPDWPEFADSPRALQYLGEHYRLAVLSNVDRASFQASNARLKVTFDAVYTAQDIGSYKPDHRNFEYLLRRVSEEFGLGKPDILHVAQSLYHDHAPANRAGLASAWIDRRHAAQGWGATVPPAGTPHYDFRFESLAALAEAHQQELRSGARAQ